MWSDQSFLFTAYTGAAASVFGGVSISKTAFVNQQKALSLNDKNEWQDVRILIVGEVSFMSDKILEALDVKLKEIKNRAKTFGGLSIIFAGDFCQLELVGSTEFDLMISSLSSKHWDNCINVIIILDNVQHFKEDPEYGKMLKRMWNGDLSTEDRKRINTRVIGYNGLQLPSHVECEVPKRLFQNWNLMHQHGVTLFLVFLVKNKFISKETFVMPVQQTKNKIPSKQQYFRST